MVSPIIEKNHSAYECLREEWGIHSEEFLVGIASRFDPIKGIAYLVDAFSRVASRYPQAKLVLIGSGSLDNALACAQAKQPRSLWPAWFSPDFGNRILPLYLMRWTSSLLPSLGRSHSIGPLLEAIAVPAKADHRY